MLLQMNDHDQWRKTLELVLLIGILIVSVSGCSGIIGHQPSPVDTTLLPENTISSSPTNPSVLTQENPGIGPTQTQADLPGLATVTASLQIMPTTETSLAETPQVTGMGPLKVSTANSRYFMDANGKIVYLTGSHTWANLQDAGETNPPPVFNYTAYLNYLSNNHLNFFRLWAWEQSKWAPWLTGGIWFSPSVYQRTGPGIALDGGPQFDLTKFNQAYFDRLRDRVIQAGNRGIYVSIMLFDGWSIGGKAGNPGNAWPGHPFNVKNNKNGINGDSNGNGEGEETHTLAIPQITDFQKAYVRKVIDTVNDLDNVLFEISNESPANSQGWQYEIINYIKSYEAGLPKQHPVGMTVEYPDGNNADLFASPADWISPNEVGGYKDNPPAANGQKVIIVDTDHLWGEGGDRQWVWKSFTRGLNPIFMDCYNSLYCTSDSPSPSIRANVNANMGYARQYADRINLNLVVPHGELSSSGYALANPSSSKAEYLIYVPSGGSVSVNLTATKEDLMVEWLNPANGQKISKGVMQGGKNSTFIVPFSGDAVLYLSSISLYNFAYIPFAVR